MAVWPYRCMNDISLVYRPNNDECYNCTQVTRYKRKIQNQRKREIR